MKFFSHRWRSLVSIWTFLSSPDEEGEDEGEVPVLVLPKDKLLSNSRTKLCISCTFFWCNTTYGEGFLVFDGGGAGGVTAVVAVVDVDIGDVAVVVTSSFDIGGLNLKKKVQSET